MNKKLILIIIIVLAIEFSGHGIFGYELALMSAFNILNNKGK